MKKILFAAAAVICAMACSKMESRDSEVFSNETLVPMTVSAVAPDAAGEMTKTTLEGTSVLWSSGDCIGIMAADGASKTVGKFTLASGKGKHAVVEKMLSGRITTQCPGTLLLAHADVTLIVDKAAFEG